MTGSRLARREDQKERRCMSQRKQQPNSLNFWGLKVHHKSDCTNRVVTSLGLSYQ